MSAESPDRSIETIQKGCFLNISIYSYIHFYTMYIELIFLFSPKKSPPSHRISIFTGDGEPSGPLVHSVLKLRWDRMGTVSFTSGRNTTLAERRTAGRIGSGCVFGPFRMRMFGSQLADGW